MPAGATRSPAAANTWNHSGYRPGSVSRRSSTNQAMPRYEEIMIEIRKTITLRETVLSELGSNNSSKIPRFAAERR
jgi:hypothetical protein